MPRRHRGIDGLSRRQKEVLRLVGQNMQAKEIARHLRISETTVRTHMDEGRRRLGVATSREAARLLLSFEREEALLNHEGPQATRIADPSVAAPKSQGEQDLRADRVNEDPDNGPVPDLTDACILTETGPGPQVPPDDAILRPVHPTGRSGILYGSRKRLADRRWAVFERRLENLKFWQWFGFAFLAAVSMAVVGGAVIEGSLLMLRAINQFER